MSTVAVLTSRGVTQPVINLEGLDEAIWLPAALIRLYEGTDMVKNSLMRWVE